MNKRRGQYASLDVGSMGVDVSMGPITNLDNKILDEVCPDDEDAETLLGKQENKSIKKTVEHRKSCRQAVLKVRLAIPI